MLIRRATPEDAEALAGVHVDSWRVAYRGLVPESHLAKLDKDRRAKRFHDDLAAGIEESYLAEAHGEVLGFLTIGECRDEDLDRRTTGEIWGIYLAPAHWRKGYASALCRYGERLLRSKGYREASLWVFEGNSQARLFYEAMGFAADGASKTLNPGADLEVLRYRKALEGAVRRK